MDQLLNKPSVDAWLSCKTPDWSLLLVVFNCLWGKFWVLSSGFCSTNWIPFETQIRSFYCRHGMNQILSITLWCALPPFYCLSDTNWVLLPVMHTASIWCCLSPYGMNWLLCIVLIAHLMSFLLRLWNRLVSFLLRINILAYSLQSVKEVFVIFLPCFTSKMHWLIHVDVWLGCETLDLPRFYLLCNRNWVPFLCPQGH